MALFRKVKADAFYSNVHPADTSSLVVLDNQGKILNIEPASDHDPASVQFLSGVIVPGFVNAHCHLELSHMKGLLPTGTGLLKFIEGVVSQRDRNQEEIADAILNADEEMRKAGIVAVGDICNRTDTFEVKNSSDLFYYSFVEMFDFWQDHLAQSFFDQYKAVYDAITESPGHQKSAVPHAPYSVSKQLFKLINSLNTGARSVSIHNQETPQEDQMFVEKGGPFIPLFEKMGFSFQHFEATGHSSIRYALENLDSSQTQLFVHNTMTQREDIQAAQNFNEKSYWVSCPNANLYIENRLPNYQLFIEEDAKVCLGTDSLTSNWQLSILEEMKTIAKYQSNISLDNLILWATKHGAEALGIQADYGTIEVGKSPGLNLLRIAPDGSIIADSRVEKIC
jgi:cytosine/adenosine deaminase-related metal-dependent hydrolase